MTLWAFIGQVLDPDHSCNRALARIQAHRASLGLPPVSTDTGGYCRARQRLPEALLSTLCLRTGKALSQQADPADLWFGRRVKVADGSSSSMPDTPANQAVYPQPHGQAPGCGFPVVAFVAVRGFRTRQITLATTLLDAETYFSEALAELYFLRWDVELDFRHIKTTMQMDVLRCKTPEMVRKEIWAHLLAYNLIRTVMWEAARVGLTRARQVSFKGTIQQVLSLGGLLPLARPPGERRGLLFHLVGRQVVPFRPERIEPRVRKRRPKNYRLMTKPRSQLKALLTG